MSDLAIDIAVNTGDYERINKPVEVQLDSTCISQNKNKLIVVEVDIEGNITDEAVKYQLDAEIDSPTLPYFSDVRYYSS